MLAAFSTGILPRNRKYTQKLAAFSTRILIEILEEYHNMMIYRERDHPEEDLRVLDTLRMRP